MADPYTDIELEDLRPELARLVTVRDVEGLVESLGDERAANSTDALALVGKEAIPSLRVALQSEKRLVSGWAAVALAKLGDEGADDRLVAFVREFDYSKCPDPFFEVWEEAVSVLGERKVTAAVQPLIDLLLRFEDTDIRDEVAGALGSIGDHRAVDPLIHVLLTEEVRAIIPECYSIEWALEELGGEKALQAVADWKAREQAWLHATEPS